MVLRSFLNNLWLCCQSLLSVSPPSLTCFGSCVFIRVAQVQMGPKVQSEKLGQRSKGVETMVTLLTYRQFCPLKKNKLILLFFHRGIEALMACQVSLETKDIMWVIWLNEGTVLGDNLRYRMPASICALSQGERGKPGPAGPPGEPGEKVRDHWMRLRLFTRACVSR